MMLSQQRIILFACLLLCFYAGLAQHDTIRFITGAKQAALIIEINEKVVRYKNPHDTLGPIYTVPLKKVEQFILKSGCVELKTKEYVNCKRDPMHGVIKNEDFTHTIIRSDFIQLSMARVELSVGYIFKNRQNGISVYINLGVLDTETKDTYSTMEGRLLARTYYRKLFYGFEYRFFPLPHKKTTPWISLGVETGHASLKSTNYDTTYFNNGMSNYYNLSNPQVVYRRVSYYSFYVNNGLLIRLSKHAALELYAAVGFTQLDKLTKFASWTRNYFWGLKLRPGFSLGYAF